MLFEASTCNCCPAVHQVVIITTGMTIRLLPVVLVNERVKEPPKQRIFSCAAVDIFVGWMIQQIHELVRSTYKFG